MEDKYLLSEEKLSEIAAGLNVTLKQVTVIELNIILL